MGFEEILQTIAWDYVWNPAMPIIFLLFGLYLTIGTRFFQFRRFGTIWRNTVGKIMEARRGKGPGILTSFQAWATAAGGAIGMGNIAGVSSAVALGGPGALFWMWMAALMGMVTKMGEVALAVHYREVFPDGKAYGGPTFYIEKGLGKERGWPSWLWKLLAIIFGVGIFSTMFITMANFSLQETFKATFNTSATAAVGFGFLYMLLVYAVILGGIPRVGRFAEIALPFMAIFYIAGGLGVIIINIDKLPSAIALIFKSAFTGHAAVGGFAGVTIMKAVQVGVARGVYSNEAGWGSSPMVHATAKVDHPVRQGLWGAFEVFLDTIIICTITGLVVVTTGVWQSGIGGAGEVARAFETVYGSPGKYFVFISLFIFVFTTSTGWYTYYETLLVHAFKNKPRETIEKVIKILRLVNPLPGFLLATWGMLTGIVPTIFWILADLTTGVPIYANLIALIVLSPVIFKLVREFEEQYLSKEDAERKTKT